MKAFLRRFKYVIAALSLCAGAVVPIALTAGPAAAADDSFVINDYTANPQGFATYSGEGVVLIDEAPAGLEANLHFEGTVTDSGGGCWPFACGNGDNSYFAGDNVWIWYWSGSSECLTATGIGGTNYEAQVTGSACANGHMYSYIVQGKPWDGRSGSESWADVGATDAQGGTGEYLVTNESDAPDDFQESAASTTHDSYHVYIG